MILVYDALVLVGLLLLAALCALPWTKGESIAFRDLGFTVYLGLFWVAYLLISWRRSKQTLGMRAWKTRLYSTRTAQTEISWAQLIKRLLVAPISIALIIGIGIMLVRKDKRSAHDLLSRLQIMQYRQ